MKFKSLCLNAFKNTKDIAKEELITKNKDFKSIVLKCLILAVLLFASLITQYAVYAVLAVAAYFICTEKSARKVYYMIFLLPFLNIIRYVSLLENTIIGDSFYLSIFLWCLTIAILGIQLLIAFIKKTKKINWFFTIMCGVLAVYFALFGPFDFTTFGAVYLSLAIVYVLYYYASEFSFKEIIFIFFVAVVLGSLFSFFRPLFFRAQQIVPTYWDVVNRFCGVSNDPNYFSGDILIVLAGLMILYFTKQIKYSIYPSVFVLTIFGLLSASKMFYLTYALLMVTFVIYIMIKNWFKTGFKISLSFFIVFLLSACVSYQAILGTVFRIGNSSSVVVDGASVTVPSDSVNDDSILTAEGDVSENGEYTTTIYVFRNNFLTGISTGRSNIWLGYLEKSFDSAKHALFGHGVGAPFLLVDNGANVRYRAEHNTFVQMIYRIGIVGILLFCLTIFSAIDRKKLKNVKWHNLFVLLIIFCLYMSLCNMLSYRTSIYITILALSLFYKPDPIDFKASLKLSKDFKKESTVGEQK